jgi:hypothetical protein
VEGQHCATLRNDRLKHCAACLKLFAIDECEKRMRAAESLERFRDVV